MTIRAKVLLRECLGMMRMRAQGQHHGCTFLHVVQKLLALVQPDVSPASWAAFQRFAVDSIPAGRVAGELGLSENAVVLAKSRVLKRLREEAGNLFW